MRVSVAMCTFNGGRWLGEQLDSLAAQTRTPDELILCDDGSTDDTLAIADGFKSRAPFQVRIVKNPQNLGLTRNFEQAISLCTGDVIFPCDQDDIWRADKIARFLNEFESDGHVGLVFADARVVDTNLSPLGHTHWQSVDFSPPLQQRVRDGDAFGVLARHSFVAGATLAFTAQLRSAILPIPAHWEYDGWIAAVAASLSSTRIIPEPLNDYRQHPRQALGGAKKGPWRRYIEARRAVDERYYTKAAEMVDALRERLLSNGVTPGDSRISHLLSKARFCRSRAAMRRSILARYPLLLRELLTGRYHTFGQGWRSAAVDALV